MPQFKMIVLSNAVEGREDEYTDWYVRQHIPDVLRVPGVVQAQRFQLSTTQRPNTQPPYKFMALYDCDADSVQQVIDGLASRAGTPEMPMTTAIAEVRISCFFEPTTEPMRRKA